MGEVDANGVDTDTAGLDTDAPVRKIKWTFVAPLGELPDEETLRRAGEAIERQEQKRKVLTLPREGAGGHTELLRGVLERARGTEGIFPHQVGEVDEKMARIAARRLVFASILAVVGAHAERSVYVVYYGRMPVDSWGRPFDITGDLRKELPENPEARKELEVLQRRLFDLHPTLEVALRRTKKQLFFAGALRRGHLLFPIDLEGEISHALVGTLLLPLKASQPAKEVEESGSDFLAGLLHRNPALNMLSPGTIQELIEGRGDVEEAARVIAMDFLGRF